MRMGLLGQSCGDGGGDACAKCCATVGATAEAVSAPTIASAAKSRCTFPSLSAHYLRAATVAVAFPKTAVAPHSLTATNFVANSPAPARARQEAGNAPAQEHKDARG
jgi:hypothetical protein